MDCEQTLTNIKEFLTQNLPSDLRLLVPISGGSDSALSFLLCTSVAPTQTIGVYIGTDLRQKDWFESIGNVHYGEIKAAPNPEVERWAYFLSLALAEHRVLVGSRNFTETALGTYSTASRVATCLPLSGLWKHEVMQLCEYVGIPDEIIKSSAQADPECGRPADLAAIPFGVVDAFLYEKVKDIPRKPPDAIISDAQREYLETLYKQNAYKSLLPLTGPVSVKAFD